MTGTPRRADAVRNRARILAAARTLVARHGVDAGMDEIAAAAGVAVGTLYRHYPTKAALIAAAVADWLERIATALEAAVDRVGAGAPALTEITALCARFTDSAPTDMAVKAAATAIGTTPDPAVERRAMAAAEALVEAGHAAGALRPDITANDLALIITTVPGDVDDAARQRWLQIMMSGITTS